MLTTALLSLLSAAVPVRSAFLEDQTPRAVRLVADEQAPFPSYAGWTRGQLRAEQQRLVDLRPGIGMPIALLGAGGGALALSALVLLSGFSGGGRIVSGAVPVVVLFAFVGVGGAALLVIGGVVLFRSISVRREYDQQLEAVDRRLRVSPEGGEQPEQRLEEYDSPSIIGPPPEGPPPLPLPPMPQSSLTLPLIFARF